MPRMGVGLAIVFGSIYCASQQNAIADPIDDALAIWSAVTSTAAGKQSDQRRRASRSAKSAQDNALNPGPLPPLPRRKDRSSMPAKGAEAVVDVWQSEEIAAAKSRCAVLLRNANAVVVPQPPIKEHECGTPAPVRLVSLGKGAQVVFVPPALVNCEMVAALNTWIVDRVQPLARKHLNASVIKVAVMSDYSCRKSLGRVRNRLSEHAYANALDIRGFVTDKGQTAYLLDNWGSTRRDVTAEAAAAKDATSRVAADPTTKRNPTSNKVAGPSEDNYNLAVVRLAGSVDPVLTRKAERAAKVAALSMQEQAFRASTPNAKFLRAAHAAACRIFGTTLGPEANDAHRNHFHVDMAKRKYKRICD